MNERTSAANEFASLGAVHLDVIDLERSLGFWRDLIGLTTLSTNADTAELGVDAEPLVVLHAGATSSVRPGHSGLYHLAIHLPNEPEFARVLARLIVARYPIAPTDHVMSKSIYLDDPDGIGLELTLETPERLREFKMDPVPQAIDVDGNISSGRDPLDVDQVLGRLTDNEIQQPLPTGTKIGHIHLHVSDLDAALAFYRDQLGFREHIVSPGFGMADLHANGRFPHRIALNTWQGADAPQPPPGTAGLRRFTIAYDTTTRLDHTLNGIQQADDAGQPVSDPAGNTLFLTSRTPATSNAARLSRV